jgi:uncharacterized membrane protein
VAAKDPGPVGLPPGWAWPVTLLLSVAGIGVATYLTYAHYHGVTALACPESSTVNCAKVTTSSQSEIFGVLPVADLGLAYFVGMAVLCTPWAWNSERRELAWLRIAAVAAGVGMVIYLVYAELFQIDAICIYCTAVHGLTLALFVAVLMAETARGDRSALQRPTPNAATARTKR